jgi:hypothetical protein
MYYVSNYGWISNHTFHAGSGGTFALMPSHAAAMEVAALLPRGHCAGLTTNAARREWGETVKKMYLDARNKTIELGGLVLLP